MLPPLTVPPTPATFRIFLANASFSKRPTPTKFVTTKTVFPPRCAVWRIISTRPRLLLSACAPLLRADASKDPFPPATPSGKANRSKLLKGFCLSGPLPPLVEMRFFLPIKTPPVLLQFHQPSLHALRKNSNASSKESRSSNPKPSIQLHFCWKLTHGACIKTN